MALREVAPSYTGAFSYSSAQVLTGCVRKYWFYKAAKVAKDPDAEDGAHPLRFGSAFHSILEDAMHGDTVHGADLKPLVVKHVQVEKLDMAKDGPQLMAMAENYTAMHRASCLRVAGVEIRVGCAHMVGYIDVVLVDVNGFWWISDIKTKARLENTLIQRLPEDPQLNLYAAYREDVAKELGLDPKKFAGCRYRVAFKTKSANCLDIAVRMDPEVIHGIHQSFLRQAEYAAIVRTKTEPPTPNYSFCENYFRPCEYWSRCHAGVLFSDSASRVKVYSQDDMVDQTLTCLPGHTLLPEELDEDSLLLGDDDVELLLD